MLGEPHTQTVQQDLEDLVMDWLNFKANEYEDEDEYLLTMERLYARKEENKVKDKEWFSTWMMIKTRKRKGKVE